MPKKSSEEHNAESIGNLLARVQSWTERLEALREAITASGFEHLTIEGQAELLRGLAGLEAFVDNGHKALRKAQEERGDFQAKGG